MAYGKIASMLDALLNQTEAELARDIARLAIQLISFFIKSLRLSGVMTPY